jgi:hypothetical protein
MAIRDRIISETEFDGNAFGDTIRAITGTQQECRGSSILGSDPFRHGFANRDVLMRTFSSSSVISTISQLQRLAHRGHRLKYLPESK